VDGDEVTARFAETDRLLAATDDRLRLIARQYAAIGEMLEMLGRFVTVNIDILGQHMRDHGRGGE
jgi:hypothetical protein